MRRIIAQSGLWMIGGVATSTVVDSQQWDSTNAWPPLQHQLIEALDRIGRPAEAELLAARWLYSNWLGLQGDAGQMHEKYDAMHPGQRGGGGEYTPQVHVR